MWKVEEELLVAGWLEGVVMEVVEENALVNVQQVVVEIAR